MFLVVLYINYQEENKSFPRIERYGVEISQQVKLDERSFFENNEVWEYFSDQEDSIRNLQQRSISMRLHLDRKNDPLFPRKGYSFDSYFKSTGYFLGGIFMSFSIGPRSWKTSIKIPNRMRGSK